MSADVFAVIVLAALMHASWNAMIKVRLDRFLSISLMSLAMGVIALASTPFVAVPSGITWAWIIASAVLHTGYKIFLIRAYSAGDLGQIYPLARGSAPLLTTSLSWLFLAELVSGTMFTGIVVMCAGILALSLRGGRDLGRLSPVALFYGLGTSLFIAGYTVVDGIGGRTAASASSYAVWMFLIDGFWMAAFCLMVRGPAAFKAMVPEWKTGLITGFLSVTAYWLVIWAMTRAPIGAVAALRESSILFAVIISFAFLREPLTRWRVIAPVMIVTGMILLRLG